MSVELCLEPYCENCLWFEPDTEMSIVDNRVYLTNVVCKNRDKCSRIAQYLKGWVKEHPDNDKKPVDTVEVVRCKDCLKRDLCRAANIWAVPPTDNWFCGDGERRKE